ncbi:hypothetical protein PFICI_13846 [Pestalotiopsis fici W106-1]|uniref:AB hydrolase-1 domain-containing protein n=1 Tax=Pestalotiopsis fici (strain W106-1 / CGMCC3.15140) TaxID=1229662 RepID=W3WJ76_PESFW|nr:uncharacterized protein PFICI_13846 [Pestalotiopsis fici W106-1]ETS73980.1 hypothetical protein PFICI_13846 [Pestalotiopsis fici W106-1]
MSSIEAVPLEGRHGPLELLRKLPFTEKSSNKPPLLFLHGAKCSAHDYMNFLPYFAAHGYPAYALSIRGHGASWSQSRLRKILFTTLFSWAHDTQSALNLIVAHHHNSPPPVLVGHSLGGGALQFMLSHGLLHIGRDNANGQIPGLILLGSVPLYGGGQEIIGNIKQVEAPSGYPHIWSDRGLVSTPKQVRQLFFTQEAEEEAIHEWIHMCRTELESAMAGLFICFPLGEAGKVLNALAGVGTPTKTRKVLCVAGVEDKLVPPAMVLRNSGLYAAAATHLELDKEACMVVTVNDCAHHLMMDLGWEHCAQVMLKWLEGDQL